MKKVKVILVLAMIFVMLCSMNAFAYINSATNNVSNAWCRISNDLTASQAYASAYCFGSTYGVGGYMYVRIVYNGQEIGFTSKQINPYGNGQTTIDYYVNRPSQPITNPSQTYTTHYISYNGASWNQNLSLS